MHSVFVNSNRLRGIAFRDAYWFLPSNGKSSNKKLKTGPETNLSGTKVLYFRTRINLILGTAKILLSNERVLSSVQKFGLFLH